MSRSKKFYLNCPYEEKDQCKELGAWWDPDRKQWYVPHNLDREDFKQWWPDYAQGQQESTGEQEGGAGCDDPVNFLAAG